MTDQEPRFYAQRTKWSSTNVWEVRDRTRKGLGEDHFCALACFDDHPTANPEERATHVADALNALDSIKSNMVSPNLMETLETMVAHLHAEVLVHNNRLLPNYNEQVLRHVAKLTDKPKPA